MKIISLFVTATIMCLVTHIQAATFYVATNGNNGNSGTSKAEAWRTPGYGSRQLAPGDMLVICGGRYVLSVFDSDIIKPSSSGEPDAWITIKGEDGARPVLVGRDNLFAAVSLDGKSNFRLENLEITHDSEAANLNFRGGITIQHSPTSSNIVLNALYVHHLDQFGLYCQDVNFFTVSNCQFEYCGFGAIGGPAAADGGWRNVTIRNCRLSFSGHYYQGGDDARGAYDRPDGFGIEPSAGPVEIVESVAEHNYGDGLDSKSAGTLIHRCIVANNSCDGVKLWAGTSRVENTLIYGQGDGDPGYSAWAPVVFSGPAMSEYEFVNVTVDDSYGGGYLVYCNYDQPSVPLQVTFRNCIFRSSDTPIWINGASTLNADHNLFYNREHQVLIHGANTYTSTTLSNLGPCNLYGDPRVKAPAWGSTGDYHLQTNSPAINLGTTNGAPAEDLEGRPRDAYPDAGAYECIGCGVLRLVGVALGTNGLHFQWFTLAGRQYRVERTSQLGGPWSQIAMISGTGAEMPFVDPAPPMPSGFYRVVLACP